MAKDMRHLASVLLEASNVADENERLKREMIKLRSDVDKDEQRQQIQELHQRCREAELEIIKLREKNKRLKQKAGEQKHKADMLEVKVKLQEGKIGDLKAILSIHSSLERNE